MTALEPLLSHFLGVLDIETRSLSHARNRLLQDPQIQQQTLSALKIFQATLQKGGKIVVTGVGKSGKVGQKIAATLSSLGSYSLFLHPTEGLHGDLGMIQPIDAILAISYTGNTEELLRLVPALRARGNSLVGLGGNSKSQLAQHCDAWIDGSVEQEACAHNLAPTSSTTLALALGDALAVALMKWRGFTVEDFAQNHPGGSLGKKLQLKVGDLLITPPAVAFLNETASFEEVVNASTRHAVGGVLLVEPTQQRLLGLITDGDIRRALQHKEKVFQLKAKDFMTAQPVTTQPHQMANDALHLMETRERALSVLPVVDAQGKALGLLRLHDLVRQF